MKFAQLLFRATLGLALASIAAASPGTPGSSQDPSSSANVDAFAPSHLEMNYFVDFNTSTTFGTITHTLQVLEAETTTVYMDIWDAVEVSMAEFWVAPTTEFGTNETSEIGRRPFLAAPQKVDFNITTPNPNTGNALGITVPAMAAGTTFYVRLTFRSLPETTALSWMTPEQTAGKKKPFVYSLCQMNFCRDWAPMIDSPSQKITYNASVTAPNGFVVSMSGNETGKHAFNETWTITTFECALKIPSYQIALIVGELESVDLGGRVTVFAEAPYIEAAAKEFADLPVILAQVEAYLTPYIWGNYSVFVMPPSYPWGGMEHVNANQVSHTLLAGDGSMLSTCIHEITHSWFGNDVGCQNWNHFWINEGVNVFMERKILGSYYGEEYAKIDYSTGNNSMYYDDFLSYGLNNSYSSLFPDIGSDDPENSFSGVPYEKGAQFMYYVESLLGEDGMQAMLRAYMGQFGQQAINQGQFKVWYEDWVVTSYPENATDIIEKTMWDTWVLEPGNGPVVVDVATTALEDAESLALEYLELNTTASPLSFSEYNSFYASQQVAFIQKLASSDGITSDLMAYIDNDLAIIESGNPKVKTNWYTLGLKVGYEAILDLSYVWLGEQGRTAYCKPMYEELVNSGRCDLATEWFNDYKLFYNTYVAHGVSRVLEACDQDEAVLQNQSTTSGNSPSGDVDEEVDEGPALFDEAVPTTIDTVAGDSNATSSAEVSHVLSGLVTLLIPLLFM